MNHTPRTHAVAFALLTLLLSAGCVTGDDSGTAAPTGAASSASAAAGATSAVYEPTSAVDEPTAATGDCGSRPQIAHTVQGVAYLRTPDSCFADLPDWPYEPRYVEIDGLRQAYVDVGPADADPVLLLHGQPSWSYLYRRMIPELVQGGHRVIAMDHLGMGRSDKPVNTGFYTFDGHADRLDRFVEDLGLTDVTLFAQDWGSIVGLWDAASNLDRYDRIVIGNGGLPVVPHATELPPADDPGVASFGQLLSTIPENQPPFFDADGNSLLPSPPTAGGAVAAPADTLFGQWAGYAYHSEDFTASTMLEALSYRALTPDEEAAYDAPFPTRDYMAAPRTFPSLRNDLVGRTQDKLDALTSYERPFLTIFGGNDPGLVGEGDAQEAMTTSIPGALGQPHHRYPDASHFLQEDQGEDIARRVDQFISTNPG